MDQFFCFVVCDVVGLCCFGQIECYQWFESVVFWDCGNDLVVIRVCVGYCGNWWYEVWYDDGVGKMLCCFWKDIFQYGVVVKMQVLVIGFVEGDFCYDVCFCFISLFGG